MTVSDALLKALAARAPKQDRTHTSASTGTRLDLDRVLSDSGIDVQKEKYEPDGRVIYEVDCLTSSAHTEGAFFTQMPSGAVAYNCHHASCSGKGWLDVKHRLTLPQGARLLIDGQDAREYAEKVSAQTLKGIGSNTNGNLFRTPGDMLAAGSVDTEWLVPGIVAHGNVTELVGKIKTAGKTTFLLTMIRAILGGTSFIGQHCKPAPVVLMSEQGDSSLMQALKRADLLDHVDLHILSWHLVRNLTWPQAVALAAEHAASVGAGLLVVDTLGRWASIAGDSENDSGAAGSAMEPLKVASASLNLAVLSVRHGRKSGGDVGDDGRGSSAFSGDADILLSLRRPEGNHSDRPGVRELQGIGRFDETPEKVLIELKGDEYVLLGDEAAIAYAEARDAVLDVLPRPEADAMPEAEIIELSKGKRTTVQRVLKEHTESGHIGRTGAGKRGDPIRYWLRHVLTEKVSAQSSITIGGQKHIPTMSPPEAHPTPIQPEPLDPTGTDDDGLEPGEVVF